MWRALHSRRGLPGSYAAPELRNSLLTDFTPHQPCSAAAPLRPHPPRLLPTLRCALQEMQQFFAHIQAAVRTYNASGELPQSLFK